MEKQIHAIILACFIIHVRSQGYICREESPEVFSYKNKATGLPYTIQVNQVTIYNERHTADTRKLSNFEITIHNDLDDTGVLCARQIKEMEKPSQTFVCKDFPIVGKYVKIKSLKNTELTPLCRYKVSGTLFKGCPRGALLQDGRCNCEDGSPVKDGKCAVSEQPLQKDVKTAAHPAIDGGWGAWSDWFECTASCGGGTQTRWRSCDSPAPQNGGQDCQGQAKEVRQCGFVSCDEGEISDDDEVGYVYPDDSDDGDDTEFDFDEWY